MDIEGNKGFAIVEFLGDIDLFRHMKAGALDSLAARMVLVYLPDGPIVKEADPVDGVI
tara:strand:- start:157 stop:330 length:174 start_codon:yes stop_codon:yes gene_type:complete